MSTPEQQLHGEAAAFAERTDALCRLNPDLRERAAEYARAQDAVGVAYRGLNTALAAGQDGVAELAVLEAAVERLACVETQLGRLLASLDR